MLIENNFFFELFLALMLGALYGVQREINKQKKKAYDFAGLRTHTIITLFGFLIGYLSFRIFKTPYIFLVGIIIITLIVIASYKSILNSKNKLIKSKLNYNSFSIISEILVIFSFLTGVIISLNMYYEAIVLTILIVIILFLGDKLHKFASSLTHDEIFGTLKFLIISVVILPILPNKNYSPLDVGFIRQIAENMKTSKYFSVEFLSQLNVFNFYEMWLIVVFVSAIAFVGYILTKTIGAKKGIILTGFLGGFMSSTALTSSFSIEAKKKKQLTYPLAVGIIIACSTMFFRVLFEIAVVNFNLIFSVFLPIFIMGVIGFIFAIILFFRIDDKKVDMKNIKRDLKSPFTIKPALFFAGIYILVSFLAKLFSLIFGSSGIYILSFLSGITDVDAITISLSQLVSSGNINSNIASFGIIIAAISNTIFKTLFCLILGTKKLFKLVGISFLVVLIIGIIIAII